MFSKKSLVILFLFALILFSGCNEKLSEEQLEEKAQTCFSSIGELKFSSFGQYTLKADDFYLKQSTSTNTNDYGNWEDICVECSESQNSKGLCTENLEECKSFNGNIHIYDFKIKEEANVPKELLMNGKVFLKDDGQPIACYITGYIAHYEGSEEV